MNGFTTNAGQTWQGVLMIALGAITAMDPGIEKTVLLGIGLSVVGLVAVFTRGSGLSAAEGEKVKEALKELEEADAEELVRRGRK